MAVIEEDVVKVSWDVDDDPFSEIIRGLKEFRNDVGGAVDDAEDGLDEFRQTTQDAADGLDDIGDSANSATRDVTRLTDGLNDVSRAHITDVTGDLDGGIQETAQETKGLFKKLRQLASIKMNGLNTSFSAISNNVARFRTNVSTGFTTAKKQVVGFFAAFRDGKSDIESVGSSFDTIKSKIKEGLAVAGITVGIGAIAKGINSTTSAVNTFAAKTGLAAGQTSMYADMIKNLYKDNMGESMDDVANSLATVEQNMHNMAGLSLDDLEGVTHSALLLRDTFDFDVNESTRSAAMLMNQFGVTGDEAFNLIAQGAQQGLDKNGDLLDSINEYSVHFKQLGFSAEDMFNILLNGAQSGTFSVDKLGDAMKEFGIRAIDGSDTTKQGFEAIGLNADEMAKKFKQGGEVGKEAFNQVVQGLQNMKDPIAQNTAGVNLFGTMWEDLGVEGVLALGNVNNEIDITDDALQRINDIKYDDAGSALASLGRTINVELGDAVDGAVNKAKIYIEEFTAGLQGRGNGSFFSGLGEDVLKLGDAFDWCTTHANILVPIIGTLIGAFVTFKGIMLAINIVSGIYNGLLAFSAARSAFKAGATLAEAAATTTATGAQVGLNAALLACPTTWIIICIVALIAVIAVLVKNWDKVKEIATNVWNTIKEKWGQLKEWFSTNVVEPIKNVFSTMWDGIKGAFSDGVNWVEGVFSSVANGVKNTFTGIVDSIKGVLSGASNWIKSNFRTVILFILNPFAGLFSYLYDHCEGFRNTVDSVLTAVKGFFINTFTSIANFFISIWNVLKAPIIAIWNLITTIVSVIASIIYTIVLGIVINIIRFDKMVLDAIISVATTIWSFIVGIATAIWTAIVSAATGIWNGIVSAFTGIYNTVYTVVNNICWNVIVPIFNSIRNFAISIFVAVYTKIVEVWNIIKNYITQVASAIWSVISYKFQLIWITVTTAMNNIKNTLSNAWNSVKTTVSSAWNSVKSTVSGVLSGIVGSIKNKFNEGLNFLKNLKNRLLQIGKDIMQGLLDGITSKINAITDKIRNLGNSITGGLKNMFKIGSPSRVMRKLGGWVTEGFNLGLGDELGETQKIASGMNTIVTEPIDDRDNKKPKAQPSSDGTSSWTPDNSYPTNNYSRNENNTYAPQFNLTVNGSNMSNRELERQVRTWIREETQNAYSSISRRKPRMTEV